jgi:hypothetical protein
MMDCQFQDSYFNVDIEFRTLFRFLLMVQLKNAIETRRNIYRTRSDNLNVLSAGYVFR